MKNQSIIKYIRVVSCKGGYEMRYWKLDGGDDEEGDDDDDDDDE